MVAALSALVAEAAAVGDLPAARVAHEAIGRLLSASSTVVADAAVVVDLASRRKPDREPGQR
jgi:hypothetical protein